MRPTRWAAVAVVLGLLAACGDTTTPTANGTTPPAAPATQTSSAPPSSGPTPTPTPTSNKGGGGGGSHQGGGGGTKTTTPTATTSGRPHAQLSIKRGFCRWLPNIFIDMGGHGGSSGGVEIDLLVGSLGLNPGGEATVRAAGPNGEYAQDKVRLHFSDSTMTAMSLDIKPALSGTYTMVLTVTVDPDHEFDQSGFTSDDTITVTVIVPSPRPNQATNVDCM
jgi:hypothetical protein